MSAPQTPPRCPDWCTSTEKRHRRGDHHIHTTDAFGPPGIVGRPWIVQEWTETDGWEPAVLTLPSEKGIVDLDATGVRAFALMVERFHPDSPLAAALTEAADELDRITGGGS